MLVLHDFHDLNQWALLVDVQAGEDWAPLLPVSFRLRAKVSNIGLHVCLEKDREV